MTELVEGLVQVHELMMPLYVQTREHVRLHFALLVTGSHRAVREEPRTVWAAEPSAASWHSR